VGDVLMWLELIGRGLSPGFRRSSARLDGKKVRELALVGERQV
jgi:hypothetical protein